MTMPRAMQALVLVTAMLSLSAFCIADDSFVFLSFSLVAAALSGVLAQGARPKRLPTIVAHSIIASLVAAAAVSAFIAGRPPDIEQVGFLCGSALVIKLFARHRAADERHVLALGSILLLVAALDGTDVLAGLPLVVGSLLMPVCAAAAWVQASTERAAAAHASRIPAGSLPVAFEPSAGASPMRCWAGFAVASVIVTAACGVLVFLGFPRQGLEGESWSRTRAGGFSLRVSLASDERIEDSRTEVMTVRWIGPDGVAIEHNEPLHLRGAVFDRYDPISQSWQVPQQPRREYIEGAGEGFVPFVESGIDTRFQVYRQVVQMRGLATNQVFSVLAPISIQAAEGMSVALDQSTMLLASASSRIGEFDRYTVAVKPYASDRDMTVLSGGFIEPGPVPGFPVAGVEPLALELWERWKPRGRAVPDLDAAALRPAARWERNRAVATALESALLSGDFRYTTDLGSIVRRRGEDPIVNFLASSRQGHCQYFASALCAMCQSMGVDARVVAGFIALEYDASQSQYIVRSSNAHAWVEVRTGDHHALAERGGQGGRGGRVGVGAREDAGRRVDRTTALEIRLRAVQARGVRIGAADAEHGRATSTRGGAGAAKGLLKRAEAVLAPREADLLDRAVLDAVEVLRDGRVQVARVRLPLQVGGADVAARRAERVGRVLDGLVDARGIARDIGDRADDHVGADRRGAAIAFTWKSGRLELAEEDGGAAEEQTTKSQTRFHYGTPALRMR